MDVWFGHVLNSISLHEQLEVQIFIVKKKKTIKNYLCRLYVLLFADIGEKSESPIKKSE